MQDHLLVRMKVIDWISTLMVRVSNLCIQHFKQIGSTHIVHTHFCSRIKIAARRKSPTQAVFIEFPAILACWFRGTPCSISCGAPDSFACSGHVGSSCDDSSSRGSKNLWRSCGPGGDVAKPIQWLNVFTLPPMIGSQQFDQGDQTHTCGMKQTRPRVKQHWFGHPYLYNHGAQTYKNSSPHCRFVKMSSMCKGYCLCTPRVPFHSWRTAISLEIWSSSPSCGSGRGCLPNPGS